jgi:site-specific DNA-methyltransferase (adenine-specific)
VSTYALEQGDVREVLSAFNDASFDALFCDPPYGFSFMGKRWDYDVPSVETWAECLRVLKPGAPLLAFGGSRTYHRLACGIEDAGFELRDCLMYLYGKGFPKSQNISLAIDKAAGAEREVVGTRTLTGNAALSTKEKGGTFGVQVGSVPAKEVPITAPATALAQAWDGYGTALKPAFEPIVLARKPLEGTMAQNVARWGVGGLAIDACRIRRAAGDRTEYGRHADIPSAPSVAMGARRCAPAYEPDDAGRWPANLLLDEDAAALLDASVAPTRSTPYPEHQAPGNVLPLNRRAAGGYGDSGGPSRFFYTAKVSTKEREAGCEGLALRSAGEATEREDTCTMCDGQGVYLVEAHGAQEMKCTDCAGSGRVRTAGLDNPRAGAGRTGGARNHHPTLKPIALTTWLARLVMPPTDNAVLLVPFAGSGSEMIGALKAGWPGVVGIEREREYVEIARARLRHWCAESEAA